MLSLEEQPPAPSRIPRWPTERPLLILNALAAAGLWFVVFRSAQSMPFVGTWAVILLLLNLAFLAAVRGSAVRVSPDQFPELHARVEELAARFGFRRTPDVYVMQQDGALNAFATRFLRTHMVVLLSDLLEACGDDTAARDMIIGHELGHIRAGHLRGRWLLMPATFIPFIGSALSRAREYTCDRYGLAAAGDLDGALLGLAILSAGGRYGRRMNRDAFVHQRRDLRGAWMLVGEWLGSHPPLAKRIWALAPPLESAPRAPMRTALRIAQAAVAAGVVVIVGAGFVSAYMQRFTAQPTPRTDRPSRTELEQQVGRDLARLKAFVEAERQQGRALPWDVWDLYARWEAAHPDDSNPMDPFSGYWYDYRAHAGSYQLWSTGPDRRHQTPDDIVLESASEASPRRRFVSRR